MPQLISHRDGFGWQTPNVTDILDRPEDPHDKTGQLRIHATLMIRRLAQLGAPVRLKGVKSHPSHTRYHLLPDRTGPRGSERLVTLEDLKNAMPHLLPELNVQSHELVKLTSEENAFTLFLRTHAHRPLNLQTLLLQSAFQDSSGYTSFALGTDLDQKPVVRDLTEARNVLILGSSNARLHLQVGIVITMMLFNSPSYLRLALVGDETSLFRHLIGSPHILGSVIPSASDFRRLLDGLIKHITQRKRTFEKHLVDSLNDYNKQAISNKELKPLPRIVVLLDTVALPDWRSQQADWLVPLNQILSKGADFGIHLIMTSPDDYTLPERISATFSEFLVLRTAVNRLSDRLPDDENVPLQFVDGVLISRDKSIAPKPLEIPAVSETEIIRAVTYWQNMRTRRDAEMQNKVGKAPSGNTGLLSLREDMLPQPSRPHADDEPLSVPPPIIPDRVVSSAQALAGYLGWLGMGPLQDILGLTADESAETLRILRMIGVLENGDGPVWRFARLADSPFGA